MTTEEARLQMIEWFSRPDAVFGYEAGYGCVYRGHQDPHSQIRCAFGCLIPDKAYSPEMENRIASAAIHESADVAWKLDVTSMDTAFLDIAQHKHDTMARDFAEIQDYTATPAAFVAWLKTVDVNDSETFSYK